MSIAEDNKNKGIAQFNKGNFSDALDSFKAAYDLFRAEGKEIEVGEMLNNIGMVYRSLEQVEMALQSMTEAREIFRELGDKDREAQTIANMAPLYIIQKKYTLASQFYLEAEGLFEEVGDTEKLADVLMSHGLHEFEHGEKRGSLYLYERGMRMLKRPTFKQKQLQRMLKMKNSLL